MRWLTHTLAGLLVLGTLAMVLAGGALWLVATESGTRWAFARVLARTGPELTIGRVNGSLLGGLVVEDVRLRLTRDELDIPRLALKWKPALALIGEIEFGAARASAVAYRKLPAKGDEEEGGVLSLPFMLRLEDAIVESLSIDVEGSVLELGETRFTGTYFGRHLAISHGQSSLGPFSLGANADIRFDNGITLATDIDWAGPVLDAPASGRVTLNGDYPLLKIHQDLRAPFSATADGTLDFTDAMRFDLALAWTDLVIPNVGHFASPNGTGKLAGTLDEYAFDFSGTLDVDGRVANASGNGRGARGELVFERAVLGPLVNGTAAGTLRGAGTVSFARSVADLTLDAQNVDPRWIHPSIPGRLSGTGTLHTEFAPALVTRFGAVALTGELRQYPVVVKGAADVDSDNRWHLDKLTLDSGADRISLDGTVSPDDLDIAVAARLDNLDIVWPGLRGGVDGEAAFAGTWGEPRGRGHVEAHDLALGDLSIDRLALVGEAGLPKDTRLDLTIVATGLARRQVTIDSIKLTLAGRTSAHRAKIEAHAEDWLATLTASGGVADLTWRGTLESFDVDEKVLGNWRLDEPARIEAGRERVRLETACMMHVSGARGCTELSLAGKRDDRLVVSAQNLNLSTFEPIMPPQLKIDGVYQMSASFADLSGQPHGAAVLTGGTTHVRVAFDQAQAFSTDVTEARASATLEAGKLAVGATIATSNGGRTNLQGQIDDVRKSNSPISGGVALQWPDLEFLTLLSPDLGQVAGAMSLDLNIGGTVAEPTLDGRGAWTGGRIAVPAWGLIVDRIEASATSRDGHALELDATGHAGDGELKLTGTTALEPSQGWPTRLKLTGTSVEAVQRVDAQIYVSPDLDVNITLPDVRVTGAVRVPRAMLKVTSLPAEAVAPSPDAVVHGVAAPKRAQPLRLATRIDLVLGDDVHYNGLNLDTKVTGGLRLDADATRSATASGTLTLAGSYNAYGQKLELERGLLLFNGPLDNPGLDVRAARTVETTVNTAVPIRVGVELTGTLKAPRTRVISTPVMSDADALSYLLLGRPLTNAAGSDTATLQTAALSMGLQQALPGMQRIGHTLGLDELSLQTTDTDPGALMAGKYLSPKVYIRYSYGLFNRIGGLLLRFKVSDKVSIETRSGDQESMDVIYNVEKD
ncbi:MAG TPA: translocation/assembly module TamB domain-containing protein [Gammaproteobacteria bacterium]|nr:translocation/assembly module TamB domain-containing protein [Gammaproteobacteria bacterium]